MEERCKWGAPNLVTYLIKLIIILSYIRHGDSLLLCDCNEEQCLSGDRSNMCVQDNPQYGCYKQYYTKTHPHVTMGCVKVDLLCRSLEIRPEPFDSEWPYITCCYTDHCNRHLPPHINVTQSGDTSSRLHTVSYPSIRLEITEDYERTDNTRAHNSQYNDVSKSEQEQKNTVHPVFVLLLVLVIIFLLVVIASILVIVKIWLYRRKRSKPRKRHWVVEQKLTSNTPTCMLLTDTASDSMTTCSSNQNTNNSNDICSYDVP